MNSQCTAGTLHGDEWHKLIYAKLVGMKKINDFENKKTQLLAATTDLHFNEESEICQIPLISMAKRKFQVTHYVF